MTGNYLTYTEIPARCPRARMQIDNHNYEVYTNNDLIAIHKPPSTFSRELLLFRSSNDQDQLREIVDNSLPPVLELYKIFLLLFRFFFTSFLEVFPFRNIQFERELEISCFKLDRNICR